MDESDFKKFKRMKQELQMREGGLLECGEKSGTVCEGMYGGVLRHK